MPTINGNYISHLESKYIPSIQSYLRSKIGLPQGENILLSYHMGWTSVSGDNENHPVGKSLRPILCLAACEMAGGDFTEAIPAAASLELIHNFSLIHDDIQDGDLMRRSRPTIWSIWGVPKAINAGNTMRIIADRTMLESSSENRNLDVTVDAALESTIRSLDMIEGQYMDMSFESSTNVNVAEYLKMVERKTGALIQSAMYVGALIATGDKQTATSFGNCGRNLGVAFQIRDDYLGIWGDPKKTGKPVGADIRRKKKSLPAIYMFNEASNSDRKWLDEIYSQDIIDETEVANILDLLDKLNVAEYVQNLANSQADLVSSQIIDLAISDQSKLQLFSITDFFVTRQK
ncbi:MAG: hypothetical protein CL763_01195 [Chloroflexi bacterium]|nr:hypothetical protein [Chloroflexota bacterium]